MDQLFDMEIDQCIQSKRYLLPQACQSLYTNY